MTLRQYVTWSPHQAQTRAIVKTLCYRLFMVLITIAVAFLITDDPSQALSIGLVANVFKTITYYVYERMWAHIAWGMETASNDPELISGD